MGKPSKRFAAMKKKALQIGTVDLTEAVKHLKSFQADLPKDVKPVKFDQTVELVMRLGIDPRQADQQVRGSIVLPHGIGKEQRVLVFAQGENVQKAEAAGADIVGGKELADRIVKEGFTEFDVAIASPDMMGVVGPLGRVLGPRGLMPSPKAGTVTADVATAVSEAKAGKVQFRADSGGNVHAVVGKLSFSEEQLVENIDALISRIRSMKPTSSKGVYIRTVAVSGTMTPSVRIAA